MSPGMPSNEEIADVLDRVARLLDLLQQERSRAWSYRNAARSVRYADRSVAELFHEQGEDGLLGLRGIGQRLAGAIQEIVETGRLRLLERLEDAASPEVPFVKVPGIAEDEAARIHAALGIESLEELEIAAHDGSLEQAAGLSAPRVGEIRAALEQMLSRSARRRARESRPRRNGGAEREPPLETLLEIDEEYRTKAEAGELRTIAPRRFNPEGEKWLPILKTRRGEWVFTALFSNTARAHELGKTRDWVVVYFRTTGPESQCTVITAGAGPLRGKRVIPGREEECREHYGL